MTPQEAHDHLFQNVYSPVFFEKLANEYGVIPQNQQQAETLLRMAAKLRTAHDSGVIKQASTGGHDTIARAEAMLDGILNKSAGINSVDSEIEAAASQLASQPEMIKAAITLQDEMARQLQA